jgi:hypothetical protein
MFTYDYVGKGIESEHVVVFVVEVIVVGDGVVPVVLEFSQETLEVRKKGKSNGKVLAKASRVGWEKEEYEEG